MVEAVMKVSLRGQRQRERLERLKAARPQGGIRVVPTDDKYRRVLKHPNGARFRAEGGIEWPNDRFTKRRIAEGVVKVEESKAPQQHRPPPPRKPERVDTTT